MNSEQIIDGNLGVTPENASQYSGITKVSGGLYIREGASLTAPALTECGWLDIREGASLTAPALTKCGGLDIREGASLTAPALTEVSGWLYIHKGANLTAPGWNQLAFGDKYCLYRTPAGKYQAGCRGPWTAAEALAHWSGDSDKCKRFREAIIKAEAA